MAFRPLTDGDCGQINALNKLTSHITQDHTFSAVGPVVNSQILPNQSDQLVEQFLQETRAMPQSFRMDDLRREMQEIESQRAALPPIPASAIKDQIQDDAWAQQYLQDGKIFHEQNYDDIWSQIASHSQQETQNFMEHHSPSQFVYSKFMKFMENNTDDMIDPGKLTQGEAQAWTDEFLVKSDEAESSASALNEPEIVETDIETENGPPNAFWDQLQKDIENGMASSDESSAHSWPDDFNSYYNTPHEYKFSDDNPMMNLPNPVERGKQFLKENDLPSAVLCFEAAVKQKADNAEAWLLLGTTQAENEQDPYAIYALQECITLDPKNLDALMAAAVSYTNESYYNQACKMLVAWLKHNPKYADLVPDNLNSPWGSTVSSLIPNPSQLKVQELFLQAAQRNPQNIDYQVQSGLGVLCNLSGEYEKAVDCYRAALSVKGNDAKLWNQLGATLANGSKSEEAVEAYHMALRLSPGFIRARYNMGITCINLRAYKQAAEHFLTALNIQARGKDVFNTAAGGSSQMSDTIWSTLQMCLSLMNQSDLRELVKNRNLKELNKIFNTE